MMANMDVKLGYHYLVLGAPRVRKGQDPVYTGEGAWAISAPAKTRNPDLAVAFLRMMCTEQAHREWCKIYHGQSTTAWKPMAGTFDHFEIRDPNDWNVRCAKVFQTQISPRTRYYGQEYGYDSELETAVAAACSEVRTGKKDSAQACKDIQVAAEKQHKQWQDDLKKATG
jgi:ABC-type glycerol-3-phosphate transport system substrate-binding protein